MLSTERIQTYLETYADHLGRKVTKSSPLTPQTTRKRLYFSDFKERLVHFNGTVVSHFIRFFAKSGEQKANKTTLQSYDFFLLNKKFFNNYIGGGN